MGILKGNTGGLPDVKFWRAGAEDLQCIEHQGPSPPTRASTVQRAMADGGLAAELRPDACRGGSLLLPLFSIRNQTNSIFLMLEWLGSDGDRLQSAFRDVFGERCRPFGNRALAIGGLSDGNEGVQWNAGYDPCDGRRWLGVNLEGMQYDDWPISRLITRELRQSTLPDVIQEVGTTGPAHVLWTRDYWQATSRPPILEREIAPTPILLSRISEKAWRETLKGALACLDGKRQWRGRATREVTLARSGDRVLGPVSPHLTFVLPAEDAVSWREFLAYAKNRMQPFYDWTVERAR